MVAVRRTFVELLVATLARHDIARSPAKGTRDDAQHDIKGKISSMSR